MGEMETGHQDSIFISPTCEMATTMVKSLVA